MMGRLALLAPAALLLMLVGCGHGQRVLVPLGERMQPQSLFRLPTDERMIYLTIDDGPSPSTAIILDLLAQYDAKATMFVHTDHIAGHEHLVQRAAQEGHSFGNHLTWDRSAKDLSAEEFAAELHESHCVIEALTGAPPAYYRPPLGQYRAERMGPALRALGYEAPMGRPYVLTSLLPWDAGGMTETGWDSWNRFAAGVYGRQLGGAAFPGAIVIFHDGPRAVRTNHTLHSLEIFLKRARARGFEIQALPAPSQAGPGGCAQTGESPLASPSSDG
ncbi:MAG: polysaccharide deacetylase family protein [Pseudomonadota bacterium]